MIRQTKRGRKPVRYYLAYGSNLNVFQMLCRCPGAHRKGYGWIDDYELLYKGSKTGAYLTIEPREGARVPVGVYTVTPADEKILDRYEGHPRFYYKKEMKILMRDFQQGRYQLVDAFVYLMHEDRLPGIPTQRYQAICREGYQDFDFDLDILDRAWERSWELCRKEEARCQKIES